MADAVVGALRVVLGADTAAFSSAMKETQSRLSSFSMSMIAIGAGLAGTFSGLGVAMALAVRGTLAEAEKLSKVAQQFGMPIEQLSGLKYAAERSGLSLEQLSIGFKTLMRNMAAAAGDGFSPMGQAFRSIGVAVTDAQGKLRASGDVMLDVADKMSGMRDSAGKSALAMQLFGEQGAQLVPMLNKGRAGLLGLSDEARKLGLIIDGKTAAAATKFNESLDKIWRAKDALTLQITAHLAPALESLAKRFADFVGDGTAVRKTVESFGAAFNYLVTLSERVSAVFAVMKLSVSSFTDELGNSTSLAEYSRRLSEGYAKIVADQARNVAALGDNMADQLGIGSSLLNVKAEIEKGLPPIQNALQKLRDQFNYDFGDPFAGVATKLDLLNAAFKRGVLPVMEYRTMLRQLQVEEMTQLRDAAKRTLEDTLASATVTATQKMDALKAAVRAGTITFEEFGTRAKAVTKEATTYMTASLDAVGSGFANAFQQFTESGKLNFRDMARSILADIAQITFKLSVIKPLLGDGGASSGIIGDFLKGLTLKGYAEGGRPAVGMPAWVGERGKELFIPDSPGTIIPNHALGAMGASNVGVSISIDARGATRDAIPALERQLADLKQQLPRIITETVSEARDRSMMR